MGLNDIRLSASALASLYTNSLVDSGDEGSPAQTPVQKVTERREQPPYVAKSGPSAAPAAPPLPTAPPASPVTPSGSGTWKYLGNNKKQILVVVSYQGKAYLPDEELTFLTRMLTACKLGLDDVAIVNSSHYPAYSSNDYLEQFKSQIVFLFGVEPAGFGLPLSFPQYQVQSFAGTTFLYAPALEERHRDEMLKSRLWVCLKRIFNL